MNKREHAVLSLFYDEGHQEVTASFLAYRMRMRASEATALLDSMVREGSLDLHVGDEGHLTYRLPPGEAQMIGQVRTQQDRNSYGGSPQGFQPQAPTSRHREAPGFSSSHSAAPNNGAAPRGGDWYNAPPPDGTDARPGGAPRRGAAGIQGQRNSQDGTDGSVNGGGSFHHHSPVIAGDYIRPDASPLAGPGENRPQPTMTTPEPREQYYPGPPWNGPGMAPNQAMIQRQDLYPAESQRAYADRIPILAGALSLLFPGMGQFYNGEYGKGFLLLFSTAFLWVFFMFWIVWIWSVIDAYMVAEARNQMALNAEDPNRPQRLLTDQRGPNRNSNAA